ncbi:sulfite exporter TauE/SafE family protein [bacterium]|nr:sulfite exporter TauE/SafE family protein [bacterium]
MDSTWSILTFFVSCFAGFLGSLLGLGGGIIVIPFLTLVLHIDIRHAIGASLISVIATSSGAAVAYLRERITNIRIAMFLEIATTLGALTGAFVNSLLRTNILYLLFGLLLLYSAIKIFQGRKQELPEGVKSSPLARKLRLPSSYYDQVLHREVKYEVTGVGQGFFTLYLAGIVSGLLGLGAGVFKVLAMDTFMRLPMKVSTTTSNFMIGVTAAASAGYYLTNGLVDPVIAGPVALGVLLGAMIGTRVLFQTKNTTIRLLFFLILLFISIRMIIKGL